MELIYLLPLFIIIAVVTAYCGWQTYKLIKHDLDFTNLLTFAKEDIFEDIPGDPDNVLMIIPPEVCKAANLNPGDTVTVKQQGNSLVIKKVSK